MHKSPFETWLDLLDSDCSPEEAARQIRGVLQWCWPTVSYCENAPAILEAMQSQAEWRRWQAPAPELKQLVAAHALYRAAGHADDAEVSLVLTGLAKHVLREVVLRWLGPRECPCCAEMKVRLEAEARKGNR